jgi:hypothetical protein
MTLDVRPESTEVKIPPSFKHHNRLLQSSQFTNIIRELKRHVPFTALGALSGIAIMALVVSIGLSSDANHTIFHSLHPLHIAFSAIVTTAMFRRYGGVIWAAVVLGFVGSVGICTLSDIVFPYLGGRLLGASISLHVCFIEHPWFVIPAAFAGIGFGMLAPWTRFPHAGHVLLSTWASLFYLTAFGFTDWLPLLPLVFVVLFFAVWIPCCTSDIVFPLLFSKEHEHH